MENRVGTQSPINNKCHFLGHDENFIDCASHFSTDRPRTIRR